MFADKKSLLRFAFPNNGNGLVAQLNTRLPARQRTSDYGSEGFRRLPRSLNPDKVTKDMMFVYVLQSLNFDKLYVGMTDNLERRLKEYNAGKSKFTKTYLPWKYVYTEELPDRQKAREREKYLKSGSGREHIKKILAL